MPSPSHKEQFEYSKSRSWDILAAAMGGAVGIGVGIGAFQFFKGHKVDASNIGPQASPNAGAGAPGENKATPLWTRHNTYTKDLGIKVKPSGFSTTNKITSLNEVNPDNVYNFKFVNRDLEYTLTGRGVTRFFEKGLADKLSPGYAASLVTLGGRRVGHMADISRHGSMSVQDYASQVYGRKATQIIGTKSTGRVVRAGNRLGVIPGFVRPTNTGYEFIDPTSLFKKTMSYINELESGKRQNTKVQNFLRSKNITLMDVAKSATDLYKSVLRIPTYTEAPVIRELASVFNPVEAISDHSTIVNFWANTNLLFAPKTERIRKTAFGSGHRLVLDPAGYYRYKSSKFGYASTGTPYNTVMARMEAQSRVDLAKLGWYYAQEKEEQAVAGFGTLARTNNLNFAWAHPSGLRLNEFLHARPMMGTAKAAAKKSRAKGMGVWVGDLLTDPISEVMRTAHGKSLQMRGLSKRASAALGVVLPSAMIVSARGANPHPLSEGGIWIGRQGMKRAAAKTFKEATQFVRPGSLSIKFSGGLDEVFRIAVKGKDNIITQLRDQLPNLGHLKDKELLTEFAQGKTGKSVYMAPNSTFLGRGVGDELVTQFQGGFHLTGIKSVQGGLELQTHKLGSLSDLGTATSVFGRAHMEVQGTVTSPVANALSYLPQHIQPTAAYHASQLKPYDWFKAGVYNFLGAPVMEGNTKLANTRRGQLADILRRHGLGDTFSVHNSGDLEATMFSGVSDDAVRAAADKGVTLSGIMKEMQVAHGTTYNELYPILTKAEDATLIDIGGGHSVVKGTFLTSIQAKMQEISQITGMGTPNVVGGSKSQKVGVQLLEYANMKGATSLSSHLAAVLHTKARGSGYMGLYAANLGMNATEMEARGGLMGLAKERFPDIGNEAKFDELLGSDKAAIHDALHSLKLEPGVKPESLKKLYQHKTGFVINITDGLSDDAARNFRIMPKEGGKFIKPLKEVLFLPFGQFQLSGMDKEGMGYVGNFNKAQIEFKQQLDLIKKGINSGTPVAEASMSITHQYNKLQDEYMKVISSKGGAFNELRSGVRYDLSGYTNILHLNDILDRVGGTSENSGFYTLDAAGKQTPIPGKYLDVSTLDSIHKSEKIATRRLADKGIDQQFYYKGKAVGLTGYSVTQAHPTISTHASIGVNRNLLFYRQSLAPLGLDDLQRGMSYVDQNALWEAKRDNDFDNWARFFFGHKKDPGIQADLEMIHKQRVGNWEYTNRLRSMLQIKDPFSSLSLDKLSVHDDLLTDEALEIIQKATTQKRATPMLDIAVSARHQLFSSVLSNKGELAQVMRQMTEEQLTTMAKYFGGSSLHVLVDSVMGSFKQVPISKGYGAVSMYLAIGRFGNATTTKAEHAFQSTLSAGFVAMTAAATDKQMEDVLESTATELADHLKTIAMADIDHVNTKQILKEGGMTRADFESRINSLTSEGSKADIKKTIVKAVHPINNQAYIDQVKGNIGKTEIQNLRESSKAFFEAMQKTGADVVEAREDDLSGKHIGSIKNSKSPATVTESLASLMAARTSGNQEQLLRNLTGLDDYGEPMVLRNSNPESRFKEEVLNSITDSNKKLAAAPKRTDRLRDIFSPIIEGIVNEADNVDPNVYNRYSKYIDLSVERGKAYYGKHKAWFAGAAALGTLVAGAHVIGALNSPKAEINDAPLPPNTPIDDGVLATPQFTASPGPPTVRGAREGRSLNSSDLQYNGSNVDGILSSVVGNSSSGGAFVHDDRSNFNRQSMMRYREDQQRSRF